MSCYNIKNKNESKMKFIEGKFLAAADGGFLESARIEGHLGDVEEKSEAGVLLLTAPHGLLCGFGKRRRRRKALYQTDCRHPCSRGAGVGRLQNPKTCKIHDAEEQMGQMEPWVLGEM